MKPSTNSPLKIIVIGLLILAAGTISAHAVTFSLYWADSNVDKIFRSDLDGTTIEPIHTFTSDFAPTGLALDTSNNKVYWTDPNKGEIRRSDLDGSNAELVLGSLGVSGVRGIALDSASGHIYFVSDINNRINRFMRI